MKIKLAAETVEVFNVLRDDGKTLIELVYTYPDNSSLSLFLSPDAAEELGGEIQAAVETARSEGEPLED